MHKHLNLILNGKGGVGKSFFAVNFIQFLKDQKLPHGAIDTDNENSTLKRFHPEARFVNLTQAREIDEVFGALEHAGLLVVDCRAASTDLFLEYFAEMHIFEVLAGMGATLTVVSPVNHDLDSVEQVKIIAKAFNDRCRYLVVKNHALTEQFAIYDASKTRRRLLDELAAKEMVMLRLHNWLVAALQQHNLAVGPAAQNGKFTLMDRQRLKNWQRQFAQQLESVREVILPA